MKECWSPQGSRSVGKQVQLMRSGGIHPRVLKELKGKSVEIIYYDRDAARKDLPAALSKIQDSEGHSGNWAPNLTVVL